MEEEKLLISLTPITDKKAQQTKRVFLISYRVNKENG